MRICPKCRAENVDAAKVCKSCAERLPQSGGKICPAGKHTMDPTWTDCVYCRQESSAPLPRPVSPVRIATVFEGQLPPRPSVRNPTYKEEIALPSRSSSGPPVPPAAAQPARRPRESTIYRPIADPAVPAGQVTPSVAKNRKIVGILVTYSWTPEGQIFPIREGRNFIGRDKDCEVCISEDQTLSGRNSHITYRQNFVIGDLVSMTGTDLDGVPIEEQFRSLGNYATIRAGATYFTFIAVKPSSSTAGVGASDTAESAG
jgi:hypothetical protein